MAIKLPISLNELRDILHSMGTGTVEVEQDNTTRFSFLGSVIDLYHSTGTFRNIKSGKKGQGIDQLVNYLSWLKENKNKPSESSESLSKDNKIIELENRITLLENRLETLTERLERMDEVLHSII